MPESSDLTIRIKAIDEASPVIDGLIEKTALLETTYDWRPTIAAFLGSALGSALVLLLWGNLA